jgi:hypothetical protein
MYRDRDVQRQRCTETEMYRDSDVQRQRWAETDRESGYMWMCRAGQGNDWTGVQRSAEELTSLMDQVLLWWPKFIRDRCDWSERIDLTDQSTLIWLIRAHWFTSSSSSSSAATLSRHWHWHWHGHSSAPEHWYGHWHVVQSGCTGQSESLDIWMRGCMDGWMDGHSRMIIQVCDSIERWCVVMWCNVVWWLIDSTNQSIQFKLDRLIDRPKKPTAKQDIIMFALHVLFVRPSIHPSMHRVAVSQTLHSTLGLCESIENVGGVDVGCASQGNDWTGLDWTGLDWTGPEVRRNDYASL